MRKTTKIEVMSRDVMIRMVNREGYICVTDIARYKNSDDPRFVIQNLMKTRATVKFLGIWEIINNEDFNRVEFDTVKNEAGSNAFVLTPAKWIKLTKAIGIFLKAGRYGGTKNTNGPKGRSQSIVQPNVRQANFPT
ncbi:DNA-binding protein (fragment) [Candidatus Desulfarcum epimagneticum]|uniref:DNA-binding protein n=1 Tax=uncultured Desulfobacteraceae bacterium TaxID=218296 RepID=A0A484HK42_9BACT